MRVIPTIPLLLCFAACGEDSAASGRGGEPGRLVFSAIPDRDETLLRQRYEPVARWLGEQLGLPVVYQHATTYADLVEQFKNGDVHLAWCGGLTGVQARHGVPGARAIAQGESDPRFHTYFIAHAETGLERGDGFPQGIAGKSFTFGSDTSTSGRLMPEYFIRTHTGKAPSELFGHDNVYSGSHDATCEQVEAGTYQCGAVNFKTYDDRVASGKTDPAVCRVIWQTPDYPDYNFTAHPAIDGTFGAGTVERLRAALLAMPAELCKGFDRERFIAAENEDYEPIRQLAAELGFVRE